MNSERASRTYLGRPFVRRLMLGFWLALMLVVWIWIFAQGLPHGHGAD